MKIRTSEGEIDLSSEDLRHFKIDSAKDLSTFMTTINKKRELGFGTTKKDKS